MSIQSFKATPQPHSTTVELRYGANSIEVNPERLDEALARLFKYGHEQVTAITWRHEPNLPGLLPKLVGRSCAMTIYSEAADGEIVGRPVNIHGGW